RIQFVDERTTTFDAPVATEELLVTRLTSFDTGVGEGGSEVVAFDSGRLYVTNGEADRIDIFDPSGEADLVSIDLSTLPSYDGVQSVAAGGGVIAAAAAVEVVDGARQPGIVALYDQETLELITVVTVGALPDSVSISPDGNTIAVANEGEFNSESGEDGVTENAPGTISLIDITDVNSPVVTTIGFDDTFASELRLFPGIDPSLDVEPEFTAFSPDGSQVFVSLQENNAIAVVDVASGALVDVFSAGSTDHNLPGNEIDATDDGVIDIVNRDTVGLRMPDAIATVEIDGTTYVLSANEGDGRGDAFDDDGNPIPFGDEARGGDIAELGLFDEGTDLEGLDRLIHSTIDGDTDDNGLVDQPTTFGSRSFTIFTEDGTEVFDSGSTLEKIIAQYAPERFNDDDGETGQNRSDAKGPEPEAITTGVIGGETYAFVGAERDSGVFIFNISNPTDPVFVDYIDGFENGDISPETIAFIGADESSTGNAQIAVAYEVSGETVLFDLAEADGGPITPPPVLPQDVIDTGAFYLALLGREADDEGGNFWVDEDLSRVELANAFLNAGEFTSSTPEANTAEIVDQLYMGVYGRDGEESGEAHWNNVGANVGDAQMVVNFVSAALAGQEGGFTTGDPFGAVEVSPGVWDFA
ncbi:MAG: choice-of-anchor I family protein, partial [Pseudomonadota bacterium]